MKLSHVLGEIPCGASDFDTAQRFSFVGIAGSFGVPFSILGSGVELELMPTEECKALAVRADPLKVRLEAEEIMSGFNEAPIAWPPAPISAAAATSAASHTRVCFPNRIFYRQGGSASVKCNFYSCPALKTSDSVTSRPVVRSLAQVTRHHRPPHPPCRCVRLSFTLSLLLQASRVRLILHTRAFP